MYLILSSQCFLIFSGYLLWIFLRIHSIIFCGFGNLVLEYRVMTHDTIVMAWGKCCLCIFKKIILSVSARTFKILTWHFKSWTKCFSTFLMILFTQKHYCLVFFFFLTIHMRCTLLSGEFLCSHVYILTAHKPWCALSQRIWTNFPFYLIFAFQ